MMTDIVIVDDEWTIPPFLRISAEDRKAAWDRWLAAGNRYTSQFGGTDEAWKLKENERRAAIEAEKKAKSAVALARLKDEHAGERYDTKLKAWVRDEKSLAAAKALAEAEFDEHASLTDS
jgi:hypothetical protein